MHAWLRFAQRAAAQHIVAWCAQPLIAALRAATLHLHAMPRFARQSCASRSVLRFAQPMLLRSMHASADFAVNRRKLGDFVVVVE